MNIIETVQKNLGFNALEKVDPNTQQTAGQESSLGNSALAQAGIPAILLGIFNSLEQNPDMNLLDTEQTGSLMERIFGKSTDIVVSRINDYSKFPDKHNDQQLEHIASEAMRVVKAGIGEGSNESSTRKFVAMNKPDTLLYLPPSLDLGTVLKNDNLDDRTGKMEGPVSSFMRKVEKTFNTTSNN